MYLAHDVMFTQNLEEKVIKQFGEQAVAAMLKEYQTLNY